MRAALAALFLPPIDWALSRQLHPQILEMWTEANYANEGSSSNVTLQIAADSVNPTEPGSDEDDDLDSMYVPASPCIPSLHLSSLTSSNNHYAGILI